MMHRRNWRSSGWSKDRICLSNAHWRSWACRAQPSIAGMIGICSAERLGLKIASHIQVGSGTAFRTVCAKRSRTWPRRKASCHRASWPCASRTRKSILCQRLPSIASSRPMHHKVALTIRRRTPSLRISSEAPCVLQNTRPSGPPR